MHPVEILFLPPYTTSSQQTNEQTKVIFCYSLLLQDFSKYLMLISKKPESCWLAMSAAYKEALGWAGSSRRSRYRVEKCLSQVSDVSRGSEHTGRLCRFTSQRTGSPHVKDMEEQERDAQRSSSSGSRTCFLFFLFAGCRSPSSSQRWWLLLSFLSCHNQKRLLPAAYRLRSSLV